jgi:hypothetical protein
MADGLYIWKRRRKGEDDYGLVDVVSLKDLM